MPNPTTAEAIEAAAKALADRIDEDLYTLLTSSFKPFRPFDHTDIQKAPAPHPNCRSVATFDVLYGAQAVDPHPTLELSADVLEAEKSESSWWWRFAVKYNGTSTYADRLAEVTAEMAALQPKQPLVIRAPRDYAPAGGVAMPPPAPPDYKNNPLEWIRAYTNEWPAAKPVENLTPAGDMPVVPGKRQISFEDDE